MSEEVLRVCAITSIRNYLNRDYSDEEIEEKYFCAIEAMKESIQAMKSVKIEGVTSMSQGSQSMSFDSNVGVYNVTPGVAALLPKPAIRLF